MTNHLDSTALIIDCHRPTLSAFVASVTQTASNHPQQLILRYALDLENLHALLSSAKQDEPNYHGRDKTVQRFTTELPIILMGRNSSVTVFHQGKSDPEGIPSVLVVGGIGQRIVGGSGSLRVLSQPRSATIVCGPVELTLINGSQNFNSATACAALAGAQLLSSLNPKSVFIVSGNTNKDVFRLRPLSDQRVIRFPAEHQEEAFSEENIIQQILFQGAHRDVLQSPHHVGRVSEAEIVAAVKARLSRFFLSRTASLSTCQQVLGENCQWINPFHPVFLRLEHLLNENTCLDQQFSASQN